MKEKQRQCGIDEQNEQESRCRKTPEAGQGTRCRIRLTAVRQFEVNSKEYCGTTRTRTNTIPYDTKANVVQSFLLLGEAPTAKCVCCVRT